MVLKVAQPNRSMGLCISYNPLFTGMFLRPPLLIAIANAKIRPLPYTHLDQANPWYDKMRGLLYDKEKDILLLSASEGMFYMSVDNLRPVKYSSQPPVSVMGINTLEKINEHEYMVGSFSGLFRWNPESPVVYNLKNGQIYSEPGGGRPIGDIKVSGTFKDHRGRLFLVDYDNGVVPVQNSELNFPAMPENISKFLVFLSGL